MQKPILKINFSDFWSDFNMEDNLFTTMLATKYEVVLSEEPSILFYSSYTNDFLKYECPKIFYTAENRRPDFKECDFAFSFDYDLPAEKHFRMPLYCFNGDLKKLTKPKDTEQIVAQKTKFCCMVVSNARAKYRNEFFRKLSEYKTVDSGGLYLNNVGGPVADKMEFIKDYKFVLSFENSSYPGYTTEKMIEPMFANSLAVYWGSDRIQEEFNSESFVNVHQYANMNDAITAIIEIDNNEALYKNYVAAPYYKNNVFPETLDFDQITVVLLNAVERILHLPAVSLAHRGHSRLKLSKQQFKSLIRQIRLKCP